MLTSIILAAGLAPVLQAAQPAARLEDVARRALQSANAAGFVHVVDIRSGQVVAHVGTERPGEPPLRSDAPMLPLSVIKVFVAASWIEHGFAGTVVDCQPSGGWPLRRMRVDDVMATGCDSAGAVMATMLRRKLGAARMLGELRRYGLHGLTLPPDASDAEWGSVLSLGESQVMTTPRELSEFLRVIGQGGGTLFSERTARRLRRALDGAVQHGTAAGIKNALAASGWRIGGKTGTGPGQCGDRCDGLFASLLSDEAGHARYAILVFVKGKGLGGGVSAHIAASVAERLEQQR